MKTLPEPIILKFDYNASIEKVWLAITELDQMQQWYFEMLETFEAEVGFETSFLVMVEDRKYTHQWKVTEVVPYQKIVYDWIIKEYDGVSYSMFELSEKDDGTQLTITSVVTKAFPSDIPEFKRESGVQGWTYLLGDRLKSYLEK